MRVTRHILFMSTSNQTKLCCDNLPTSCIELKTQQHYSPLLLLPTGLLFDDSMRQSKICEVAPPSNIFTGGGIALAYVVSGNQCWGVQCDSLHCTWQTMKNVSPVPCDYSSKKHLVKRHIEATHICIIECVSFFVHQRLFQEVSESICVVRESLHSTVQCGGLSSQHSASFFLVL